MKPVSPRADWAGRATLKTEPDAATHAGAEKAGHEGGERGRRGQGGERRLGHYRSRRSTARAVRAHSLSRAGTGA